MSKSVLKVGTARRSQDDGGNDGPDDLEAGVAVYLLRRTLDALLLPELEDRHQQDDLHNNEDNRCNAKNQDPQPINGTADGPLRIERRLGSIGSDTRRAKNVRGTAASNRRRHRETRLSMLG